ncbi:hypothetical protein [Methanogenium cariaci]|nr:hypothetical protein [Methanogenium cariaci]
MMGGAAIAVDEQGNASVQARRIHRTFPQQRVHTSRTRRGGRVMRSF